MCEIILEDYRMKNKSVLLTLLIIICSFFIITSCSNQKPVKSDTPTNIAIVLNSFLRGGNYENFNKLFTESRKNSVSVEQFKFYSGISNVIEVLTYKLINEVQSYETIFKLYTFSGFNNHTFYWL